MLAQSIQKWGGKSHKSLTFRSSYSKKKKIVCKTHFMPVVYVLKKKNLHFYHLNIGTRDPLKYWMSSRSQPVQRFIWLNIDFASSQAILIHLGEFSRWGRGEGGGGVIDLFFTAVISPPPSYVGASVKGALWGRCTVRLLSKVCTSGSFWWAEGLKSSGRRVKMQNARETI